MAVELDHGRRSTAALTKSALLRGPSMELSARTAPETHAGALELATGVHSGVGSAVAELASLRARLAHELAAMGLLAASSGTYPLAHPGEFRVSTGARYGAIGESMRGLARREPTRLSARAATAGSPPCGR
jgi:gamma-glutamyl:cysteine ligase YbdK (ATP-grasp superfamily)